MEKIRDIETSLAWGGGVESEVKAVGTCGIKVTGLSHMKECADAWSPPHMFIAAVEGCFFKTLMAIMEKARTGLKLFKSHAVGELVSEDGKHKSICNITIFVEAGLEDQKDENKVRRLMDKAEEYCLVARSVKCSIKLDVKFV